MSASGVDAARPARDTDQPVVVAVCSTVEPERRHQPVTLQRRRTQLEQQRAESFDRRRTSRSISPRVVRRHRARGISQHLQAHVDGAHHLDRVVVDVGRDLPTLLLLRVLQPLRELAPLLERAPQDVEAPPELVLGLLLRR